MYRTELNIPQAAFSIRHTDPIFTIGSCFADNIGTLLSNNKFEVATNPYGTVYNPMSLVKLLTLSMENQPPDPDGYVLRGSAYMHHDFHSSFFDTTKERLCDKLTRHIGENHAFLSATQYVIMTLGTAFIYRLRKTAQIVANCHKLPAAAFSKELLTQKQLLESFEDFYRQLKAFNPHIKIILSVSPVRHIKDTLALNSVSKSTLRLFCHSLSERYDDIFYFPAYELMLDDLRDYRYYQDDLIHPTTLAIKYIWEKFQLTLIDSKTQIFLKEWEKIQAAMSHRPFNKTSLQHQQFIRNTIKKIEQLDARVDFSEELNMLNAQLVL